MVDGCTLSVEAGPEHGQLSQGGRVRLLRTRIVTLRNWTGASVVSVISSSAGPCTLKGFWPGTARQAEIAEAPPARFKVSPRWPYRSPE